MNKLGTWAGALLVFGVMIIAIAGLFAWFVQFAWNATMPAIFGLTTISVWQGFCLSVLGQALFKTSSAGKSE